MTWDLFFKQYYFEFIMYHSQHLDDYQKVEEFLSDASFDDQKFFDIIKKINQDHLLEIHLEVADKFIKAIKDKEFKEVKNLFKWCYLGDNNYELYNFYIFKLK